MADERAERLKAEALKDRGYIYPEWELVAREDPDFMATFLTGVRALVTLEKEKK
jgi:hypothetical protein